MSFNPLSSRWSVSLDRTTVSVLALERVSIRFHRGGPSHRSVRIAGGTPAHLFQSAFIAVARLTHARGKGEVEVRVSIRFHRGGPSHCGSFPPASAISVSIRFHRGGPSHAVWQKQPDNPEFKRFNPLSSRWPVSQSRHRRVAITVEKVSIRFHRGGPSHSTGFYGPIPKDSVSIRFHRGGPSHMAAVSLPMEHFPFQSAFIAVARLTLGALSKALFS